jgi:hypothetical protein
MAGMLLKVVSVATSVGAGILANLSQVTNDRVAAIDWVHSTVWFGYFPGVADDLDLQARMLR